ncbi:hypothetical protein GCM10028824_43050 [Hymenobacter segetis]|uniref:Uncharacterized protein n=1 Tax=Hymenobacter segetis TaxID=2025509 RepID=A0ABU9LVQ6_9BACT
MRVPITLAKVAVQTSSSGMGKYYLVPSGGANTAKYDVLRILHKGDVLMPNGLSSQPYLSDWVDYARANISLLSLTASTVMLPSSNTYEMAMTVGATSYHKDNVTQSTTAIGLRTNRTKYLGTASTSSDYRPFIHDFNAKLQTVSLTTGVRSLTVSNSAGYAAIDAAGFYGQINQLAPALRGKTENLTVNNLRFIAQSLKGGLKIVLVSFDIIDNGNTYHIGS